MWAQPSQKSDSKKNAVIPHTSIIKRLWDYLSILPTVTDLIFFFFFFEHLDGKGTRNKKRLVDRECFG